MPSGCSCPIKPRERDAGEQAGWGMFLGIPRETGSSKGLTSFISFPLHPSAVTLQAQQGWFTFQRPHSRLREDLDSVICLSSSPDAKAVAGFALLWEDPRGSRTVRTERGAAKADH